MQVYLKSLNVSDSQAKKPATILMFPKQIATESLMGTPLYNPGLRSEPEHIPVALSPCKIQLHPQQTHPSAPAGIREDELQAPALKVFCCPAPCNP